MPASVTTISSNSTAAARETPLPFAVTAAFSPVSGLAEAEDCVRRLALGHYENFSVVTRLVPRSVRQDFCNLYAFCRTADDIGDEIDDPQTALEHLAALRESLADCYTGRPSGAVFVALASTIKKHDIPIEPFLDLISAFEQDQTVTRYDSFAQLLDYCSRSANPVGRLVLYVCGYRDERRQRLSDQTCTALQLTNFWQDIRRDFETLDRIYIPGEWMKQFAVDAGQLSNREADGHLRDLVRFAVEKTDEFFDRGDALLPTLSRPVAAHVSLFARGGRAVLDAIRAQDYDTLAQRPTLSRWKKTRFVAQALGARALTLMAGLGSGA